MKKNCRIKNTKRINRPTLQKISTNFFRALYFQLLTISSSKRGQGKFHFDALCGFTLMTGGCIACQRIFISNHGRSVKLLARDAHKKWRATAAAAQRKMAQLHK